jgi:hypothetical protein
MISNCRQPARLALARAITSATCVGANAGRATARSHFAACGGSTQLAAMRPAGSYGRASALPLMAKSAAPRILPDL